MFDSRFFSQRSLRDDAVAAFVRAEIARKRLVRLARFWAGVSLVLVVAVVMVVISGF